jgi:N-acetylneuraminic acid mutarotase
MKSNNKKPLAIVSVTLAALLLFGCQKDQIAEITLKTNVPTYVAGNEASVSAEIISNGGLTITKRGVCFSINENPTPIEGQVLSTSTSSTFTVTATNLIPNKKYYCRAFAESNSIVFYGQQVSFTTLSSTPYVQTSDLKESDATNATFGGNIISDGGYTVTARGLVWNTTGNPTLQNNSGFTLVSTSLSTFESKITGLTSHVTYYVCAYATNQEGTSYGKVRTFKNGWTIKANVHPDIANNYNITGFAIGSKGYVISYDSPYNNFFEYDPVSKGWNPLLDFPGNQRRDAVVFSIGTKAYVGLGEWEGQYIDFWEYNPLTPAWSKLSDFPGGARSRAFAFSAGGKGYVGGGYNQSNNSGYNNLDDLWEFNPISNTWVQKANFPGGDTNSPICFTIADIGYVADIRDNRNSFWQYNPATNKWSKKGSFKGNSRNDAVGLAIGYKGYIGLGQQWNPQQSGSNYKDFWEYDPANNSWTRKADFAGGTRRSSFSFSLGNKGFVGGGRENDSPMSDFWEYTP